MSSNNILINNAESYNVQDEDMPHLLEWLESNGHKARECIGLPPYTIVDETDKPEVTC